MKFPSIEKYINKEDLLITSNEHSREQQHIPDLMREYGGGTLAGLKSRKHTLHRMVGCLYEARKSASSIDKNPKMANKVISDADLSELEKYAKALGVSDIGYTKVDQRHIFKRERILYENAIVITMEMKKDKIKKAPSKEAVTEIFRTYYQLGVTVNKISDFLRKHGYKAMAGPAIGGAVSYVPLAMDAGLGVIGKHGLLISDKNYGPSLRIAAVYTDIENLPITKENPHMWVKEFCNKCNKCLKSCPAGAIYKESIRVPEDPEGYRCVDVTKCATPFANNYGCTVCIKSCTFFNNDYEKIKQSHLKNLK
ncbi:4Fe-4S binding protein [Clostridium grantii]|uniref:4Fe-4S binding domain-containing protein n=1 Tax=Clostridium grantii DSM 8605 TaxID=1121316 RepID=A0A1M5S9H0_9CLOT|nr:reductive dehalogenase domain-containing protein [Clostridium grantii]SHH35131.1 4Fe-4S binding domain-containing protein [Clostridium grantii DSM 8605]